MGSIPLTSANPRQNCIGSQVLGTLTRRLLKTHRFKYKFSKKIWVQPQITFVLLSLPLLEEPLLYSNFRTAVLPVIDNIHCSVRIAINYHLIEFWKRPAYLSKTIKVFLYFRSLHQTKSQITLVICNKLETLFCGIELDAENVKMNIHCAEC